MAVAAPAPTVTGVSNGNISLSDGTTSNVNGATPAPIQGVRGPNTPPVGAPAAPKASPAEQFLKSPYAAELASIGGPESYQGPDMSGYIDSFNRSYNDQMASIKAGLTQSMGELQGRRDQSAAIVAKLPQEVNTDYNFVTQNGPNVGADTQDLTARANAVGGANNGANANVLRSNMAADKGSAPYMNLGITAATQAGEAALNSSANTAEANAAAQRTAAEQAMYMQQAQAASSYANARQDRIAQFTESQIANAQALATQKAQQPARNPALAATGLTQADVDSVMKSPQYTSVQDRITNGGQSTKDKEYLYWQLRQPGMEKVLAVVTATNPDYFTGVKAVTGTTSSPRWGNVWDNFKSNTWAPTNPL